MKRNLKYYTVILFVSFMAVVQSTSGQPKKIKAIPAIRNTGVSVWHQYRNDSLQLLWMPVSTSDWLKYNAAGYQLARAEYENGKKLVFRLLTSNPIIPSAKIEGSDKNPDSRIAQQVIAGEKMSVKLASGKPDLSGEQESNNQNLRHLLAMLTAFKSFKVARSMGLGFVDVTLKRDKQYVYRIIAGKSGERDNDTSYVQVNTARDTKVKQLPAMVSESQEKAVMLTWPAKRYAGQYILYHVERSTDGKKYERLTETPKMLTDPDRDNIFYRDSIGVNYRPCLYRLTGMTAFGEWHTSNVPVVGSGKDLTPPEQPFIESAKHLEGKHVELRWKQKPEGDLNGFWIGRSNTVSGKFERLTIFQLSTNTNRFTDKNADPEGTNHYIVFAVDTAGNERASLPAYVTMNDSIPPAIPTGVICTVDTANKKGIVTIRWKTNRDKDLKGYYVYYANDPDHEFSQITRHMLTDTVFNDTITLKSLTRKAYYRVVAMDTHFNHSSFSEIAAITRPDIIAPIAPLITKIEVVDSMATVFWQRSPSNDVAAYRLYRQDDSKVWQLVGEFNANTDTKTQFQDKLPSSQRYNYAVEVVDESGLLSGKSPARSAKLAPALTLHNIPQPSVTYISDRKESTITWTYPVRHPYSIAIYRGKKQGPLQLIGFVRSTDAQFTDHPPQDGRYLYYVKAIHEDGRQTKLSTSVEVNVKIK